MLLALGLVGALFVACGGDDDAGDQGDMAMEDDAEEDGHDEMAMEDDAEEDGHDEMAMEDDAEEDGHDEMAMEDDAEEGDDDEMAMEDAEEGGAHGAGEHEAEAGGVQAQPDNSTRVTVTMREWAILSDFAEVEAGTIYFLVENQGPEHPHEFVIIASDLGLGEFPIEDGAIPDDALHVVGKIAEFGTESWASIAVDLSPGRYILICNISDEFDEDPEPESHYELGMRIPFIVN